MPARQERCKPDRAVHFRPAPSGRAPARILPPTQTAAMLARQALRTIFSNTSTALSSSGHSTMFDAGALRVDQQGVELKARREDADRQAERFAAACGAQPERLGCRDPGAGDAPARRARSPGRRRCRAPARQPWRSARCRTRTANSRPRRRCPVRHGRPCREPRAAETPRWRNRNSTAGNALSRSRRSRWPPCRTRRRNSNAPGWSSR